MRQKYFFRPGILILLVTLTGLLLACGSDNPTTAPGSSPQNTTVNSSVATAAPSTSTASLTGTSSPATQSTQINAASTISQNSTTPQAASPTFQNVATTLAAPNSQPTPAPSTPASKTGSTATASTVARPPVGNSYPAGPAPTAAPPQGGLVDVSLQVPAQYKNGRFARPLTVKLPAGFSISLYSRLEGDLRFGTYSPDGRLFLSERRAGRVMVLKDNGTTGEPQTWAEGLNGPHGLAFHSVQGRQYLYVAEDNKVSRFPYENGQVKALAREVIVNNIPTGGNHTSRSIAFGPDNKMYIAVGSTCNVCEESDPRRAAVSQFNDDGTGERLFATGLRNEVGIKFNPATGEFWGVENSRDNAGANQQQTNEIPPEEINIIQDGGFYGWPYCYSNQIYDAQFGKKNADFCKQSIPPALPMQAHSAPLGFDFYFPGTAQFPADFKGDAFVAFHGSWNRSPATGYKVVRVRVKDGRPVSYEDFATGWLTGGSDYWGRPVDAIVAPDGSLMVTDDLNNVVYRISYQH